MPGTPNRRLFAAPCATLPRACRLLGVGVFAAALGCLSAAAQTLPPTTPASPTDPTAPSLPTDSTAPATFGPAAAPSVPLVPTQTSPANNPFPDFGSAPVPASPTAPPASLGGAGALPGGSLSPEPVGTPAVPANGADTTNNIGTARRFQYNFALTLGATYDDNIFLESGQKQSDVYFTIQPSVSLGFGGGVGGSERDNFVRFTYSPQILLYADHPEVDTVQHFVTLSGTYHLPRITLTGSQNVQILDSTDVGNPHPFEQTQSPTTTTDPISGQPIVNNPVSSVNLDTGQRTRLNVYSTSLSANYYVSDKVSYDAALQFSDSDYQTLISSSTLAGSVFFNYSPTGKTTVGLGVTGGYVFADAPTPDQTFEQGNLRFSYAPSPKLTAAGQVGLELRQSSARKGTDLSPVFELDLTYSPFDGTSFSLTGNRQIQTSAVLGAEDYTITGLSVSFSQRFLQRAFFRLSAGYTHTDYTAEANNVDAARSDNYYYLQPGVDFNVRENVTAGGFYSFRTSTSSENNRDFTDQQVGARLSLGF